MPELPEVETIKRDLLKRVKGKAIVDTIINDTMVVRSPGKKEFVAQLKDQTVFDVRRRGKAIIIELSGGCFLVVQPVMTGQLIYGAQNMSSKVTFALSNGKYLNYNDQRRFGRLNLVRDLGEMKFLRSLGIEPLGEECRYEWLEEKLSAKTTAIKPLLMDQKFLAGIGNIYACEILFRAHIHPLRPAKTLKNKEVKLLHQVMTNVLTEAIRLRGSSVNTYRDVAGEKGSFIGRIKVYGREGKACVYCGGMIKRIVQNGRSTFFCRHCQG